MTDIVERIREMVADPSDPDLLCTMAEAADEIERLQRKVVNRNARALEGDKAVAVREFLLNQIEASQAREEKLRWYIQGYCTESWGAEALAIPHDDSALKERLAKERERCAKYFEDRAERYLQDYRADLLGHAEAIRNLGDE